MKYIKKEENNRKKDKNCNYFLKHLFKNMQKMVLISILTLFLFSFFILYISFIAL